MDLVSLRMFAASIGAVGLIAACGSGASAGNSFGLHGANVPDATAETGPAVPATTAPMMMTAAPASDEAGPPTCTAVCTVDSDCASPCGNGTWCCGNGTCFSPSSGTCDSSEAGSDDGGGGGGDDGSTAAPAPSM